MRLVAANCDKERGGTRRYVRHLKRLAGRPAALLTSERGRGKNSTRLQGIGKRVKSRRRNEIGRIGVHRWADAGYINGIYIVSVHGPHKRTVGAQANLNYLHALAKTLPDSPWIVGGDYNRNIHEVAHILGGQPHGTGVDGFVTRGVTVLREGTDNTGRVRGWTDHPAHWIDIN